MITYNAALVMKKMTLKDFNGLWTYEAGKIDGWYLTAKGDCVKIGLGFFR